MKTLTEQDLQQFTTYWNKGYNCQQISLLMPYNKTTLYYNAYRLLKDKGIIESHNQGRAIMNIGQQIREAYQQGMTDIEQLSERFGKKKNSVYIYLVPLHRSQESKDLKAKIIKQLQNGEMSQSDIARLHNVSRQYVHILKNEMEMQ